MKKKEAKRSKKKKKTDEIIAKEGKWINTIENLIFKIDISLAIVPYFFLQILLVVDLEVIPSRRKNANSTAFTAGFPD